MTPIEIYHFLVFLPFDFLSLLCFPSHTLSPQRVFIVPQTNEHKRKKSLAMDLVNKANTNLYIYTISVNFSYIPQKQNIFYPYFYFYLGLANNLLWLYIEPIKFAISSNYNFSFVLFIGEFCVRTPYMFLFSLSLFRRHIVVCILVDSNFFNVMYSVFFDAILGFISTVS